jgi:hypothetical protein
MSTLENKVEVIREWLVRQAAAHRLTNPVEVGLWAGLRLAEKGYRTGGSAMPVGREAVFAALEQIARDDVAAHQPLLPALVVHFTDQLPGHRFAEWAIEAGLMEDPGDANGEFLDECGERRLPLTDEIRDLHAAQVAQVFANYGPVNVPDDASSLA